MSMQFSELASPGSKPAKTIARGPSPDDRLGLNASQSARSAWRPRRLRHAGWRANSHGGTATGRIWAAANIGFSQKVLKTPATMTATHSAGMAANAYFRQDSSGQRRTSLASAVTAMIIIAIASAASGSPKAAAKVSQSLVAVRYPSSKASG